MTAKNSTLKPITTELQLKKLNPSDKVYDVRVAHCPGLYVRVGKSGIKSFRWDRGRGQKPRHITHGTFPALSLKQAKQAQEKARQQHVDGVIEELAADVPKTINALAETFYSDRIVPKRKRPEAVRQVLDHDILPLIGKMKPSSVSAAAVRKVVRVVVDRGATVHAGRVLAILKQMLRFGVALGVIDSNPAEAFDNDILGIESNQRDRVLAADEIKLFWDALEDAPKLSIQVRVALQLLILLGLRSGELRQAQWQHLDTEARTLTIPVENQKLLPKQIKSARPFVVPLDEFALDLLQEIHGLDEKWIFPGTKDDAPFTDKVLGRVVRRMLAREVDGELALPVDHFTPHDLRRTLRTGLSKLKVQPHVAERCLNHSMGKILQTYDHYDYLEEHREALEKWSTQVQLILGKHGTNVVRLEKSA